MRIIPTQNGAILEHHYVNGDGVPSGPPDRFSHNTIQDIKDHLDEHLAEHMPEEGDASDTADVSAGTGTPRGRRA
jgi:hypothetical protein